VTKTRPNDRPRLGSQYVRVVKGGDEAERRRRRRRGGEEAGPGRCLRLVEPRMRSLEGDAQPGGSHTHTHTHTHIDVPSVSIRFHADCY